MIGWLRIILKLEDKVKQKKLQYKVHLRCFKHFNILELENFEHIVKRCASGNVTISK